MIKVILVFLDVFPSLANFDLKKRLQSVPPDMIISSYKVRDGNSENAAEKSLKYVDRLWMISAHYTNQRSLSNDTIHCTKGIS